ncbi:MAG: DUF1934 domain-containing protein [Clostridia bacterium]
MRNAKIKISSTEEDDNSEITLFGKAWEENFKQFIEYDETSQADMGVFKTLVFYDQNSLTIRRIGDVEMDMVFDENKLSQFPISTKYGDFDVVLHTETLKIERLENGADIEIIYDLSFSNQEIIEHTIKMIFRYLN